MKHLTSPHSYLDRARARYAKDVLGDAEDWERAFVYEAFLSLLDKGIRPTKRTILAESSKLGLTRKAEFEAKPDADLRYNLHNEMLPQRAKRPGADTEGGSFDASSG